MNIIFADQAMPVDIQKSIFLAGPSPRRGHEHNWRDEALGWLEHLKYDGTVFIPIPAIRFMGGDDSDTWTYDGQIAWECEARNVADQIVFWLHRDIEGGLPGLTTNVEFGEDLHSGKIVYGRPNTADSCRYLDKRISDMGLPVFDTLESTLKCAVDFLGEGATREFGEIYIPLFIWRTPQFQAWYGNLVKVGNNIKSAKLLSHVTFGHKHVFSFSMKVNVWVKAEQRYKDNEIIFTRTDTSSVVAWYQTATGHVYVVLVKEFRSPVNNSAGFVYELPSGSSPQPNMDPRTNAQQELSEEAGLSIQDLSRFEYVGIRQLAATFSTHCSSVYRVQLTKEEFAQVLVDAFDHTRFGDSEERTYIEVVNVHELQKYPIDFSVMGMILNALPANLFPSPDL